MPKRPDTTPMEFLRTLFARQRAGLVELRAIPVKGSRKPVVRAWTKSPREIEAFAAKYGKRGSEYGVYFGVCKRSKEGGSKQHVTGATCLWADVDCVVNGHDVDTILRLVGEMPSHIQPSIVVNSGGGLHFYWLFGNDYTFPANESFFEYVQEIEDANRIVGSLVGGDSVYDVTRVLRLPGTFNNKRKPEKECKVVYCAHHLQHDLPTLLREIGKWGKVIDGDRWVPVARVKGFDKTRTTTDAEDAASLHKFASALRGRNEATIWRLWQDRVRQHAPRGYMGIHEAIVVTTARLHCAGGYTADEIVEKVIGHIRDVPDLDATGWDWDAERRKVRAALETWGPKWKQMQADERRRKKVDGGNRQVSRHGADVSRQGRGRRQGAAHL